MAIGIVAQKRGMTRLFTPEGLSVPVTVLEVLANRVSQLKTCQRDGYSAIQVAYGQRPASRVNKPVAGHLSKAGIEPARGFCEFRLDSVEEESQWQVGQELKADEIFATGQQVDVTGDTKGKGFAGVIKRYHFSTQDATHGNSLSHRAPGSIGQNQTPGRVFKGKRMAGHLGDVRRTIQNLEVAAVDTQRGLLLIKGAVPGATGGIVVLHPAVKAPFTPPSQS